MVSLKGRRLSSNQPQGGAVFLHHRRKQKSFDITMLPRDSAELEYLSRGRSPSPSPDGRVSPGNKTDFSEYVIEEILLTEIQYVQDLADIVEGYLEFSRSCVHITEHEIVEIYSNIEDIYSFHKSFLSELKDCGEEPVAIAKCFINRGADFQIYAQYVTNYPNSITCLSRLLRKAVVNDAYRKRQLILGHGLPVGSYLHKPVQRILKYHLLLQNLLKHFPEDTFGRETITTSLQCMTDCAHNINELKRSHEHAMRIQEIQSVLYHFEGYNLLDFGKLILEGDLRMHGAKSFRHIYLFEKGLIICKKMEDGAMSCKTVIMCNNLMLIECIPRDPLSFHLLPVDCPKNQNTLQAKTLDQKRQWCSQIKKYILESYDSKIPEKAKELLLTLTGKSENDEKFAKQFKSFTLKSHQTPEYLEKKRRKSQPFASLSAGDTLPRAKKRAISAAGLPRTLFTSSPCMTRRHSLSDLKTEVDPVNPSERSYDEQSARANHLRTLLDKRYGLENSTWSPEVLLLTRRFRVPLLRRTDSYSQAILTTPCLSSNYSTDIDSSKTEVNTLKPSSPLSCRSSLASIVSDSSFCDDTPKRETASTPTSDSEAMRKAKTETSLLLSKLSQLKEKTSSKLTDLLKKSPIKLLKESPDSLSIPNSSSAYDIHSSQSIVGRRLSHSDTSLSLDLCLLKQGLDPSCAESTDNLMTHQDSSTTLVLSEEDELGHCKVNDSTSSCEEIAPQLPPKLQNRDVQRNSHHDSTMSLYSTTGGTLERSTESRQGYSTDNLADVEENDYVNVDYGDNATPQIEAHINDPIYDTVKFSAEYDYPGFNTDDVPPALPPLPEFLIKKRLAKTVSDSVVTLSPQSTSTEFRHQAASNRLSLPNDIKLNKPASEFWIALQKYMETGITDHKNSKQNHRPLRHSEGSLKLARNSDEAGELEGSECIKIGATPSSERYAAAEHDNNVYKIARKYSTKMKSRKGCEVRKSAQIDEIDEDSTSCTSDGTTAAYRPRRISSVRLRRTNSSRIKKFQVILDSDEEYSEPCKVDSGAALCDVDSGSDCNDIYEKQSMAALESFTSDDEMRDSAIYSEGEEVGVISPVTQLTASITNHKERRHSEKVMSFEESHLPDIDLDLCSALSPRTEKIRKTKSLPRSRSLPSHTMTDGIISSVEDIISRPVSSNILARLQSLQRHSTFEKEVTSDESDALVASFETSVQKRTQTLQQRSSKTFSKLIVIPNEDCQSVTERQQQLVRNVKKLVKQPSSEQLLIGAGLVKQVKAKLHVK